MNRDDLFEMEANHEFDNRPEVQAANARARAELNKHWRATLTDLIGRCHVATSFGELAAITDIGAQIVGGDERTRALIDTFERAYMEAYKRVLELQDMRAK